MRTAPLNSCGTSAECPHCGKQNMALHLMGTPVGQEFMCVHCGTEFRAISSVRRPRADAIRKNKVAQRKTRERDIEAYLVKRVKAMGGECRKVIWQGRRGAPDRLVMLPLAGYEHPPIIFVELKASGIKPESHQLREHARMRKMGQRVVVIDSIEAVDELLK